MTDDELDALNRIRALISDPVARAAVKPWLVVELDEAPHWPSDEVSLEFGGRTLFLATSERPRARGCKSAVRGID
jgi:hypothetical protein